MVHIALRERLTDRVRSLVEPERYIVEDMPRNVLFAPHLLERYETLRMFARLAHLAPHLAPLPQCHTLEIILDLNMRYPIPSFAVDGPLQLPELRAVVVGNGQERPTRTITVDAGQLRKYLSQLLGARCTRPSLRLHGVAVTGNRDALFSEFEEAQT
ncbi:hypothetical protein AURDEDRAFT_117231 [Auricularia subglabra TFB-10046 SS5]|nr:hypothetical protein AURDEDRAFT_117231 [Auricularia subglabra TFB-10046 SS5]